MHRNEEDTTIPNCWVYDAGDGWTIYAGKTDEDNDLLSTRFARPGEHWFHVNGMPGSHVILRAPENVQNTQADKGLIEKAAAVAAWHSKARNGGWCSVSTTLAANVSKERGAKPGLVTVSNVKNIKVKPALPGQANDGGTTKLACDKGDKRNKVN